MATHILIQTKSNEEFLIPISRIAAVKQQIIGSKPPRYGSIIYVIGAPANSVLQRGIETGLTIKQLKAKIESEDAVEPVEEE